MVDNIKAGAPRKPASLVAVDAAGKGGLLPVAATATRTIGFTATVTNNSAVLSVVSSFSGLAVGMKVTGTGIESGAAIQSMDDEAATITLTKVCKGSTKTLTACNAEVVSVVGAALTDGGFDWSDGYSPWYNLTPDTMRGLGKFLGARGAAIAGKYGGYNTRGDGQPGVFTSNILVAGDSKVIGNTPVSPNVPKRLHAPYNQVANILTAMGGADVTNNALTFGYTDGNAANFESFDPRVDFETPGDWSFDGTDPSVVATILNSTTTTYLDFTPADPVDSFDIVVRASSGATEQFSWAIDGGSATTVSVTGQGSKLYKINVSAGTLGAHTLRLRRVGGGVRIHSVIPKNSTKYALNIINVGIAGSTLSQRSTRTNSANTGIGVFNTVFAPVLVMLQYGYVDIGDSSTPLTAVADTIANYNTEIDRWQAAGVPVIVVSPSPWDDVNLYRDDASQRDYLRALRAMCLAQGVPMINMDDRWGAWQEAGNFVTHYARPDPAGNADMGYTIARALAAL
jgi:hypothetical protein